MSDAPTLLYLEADDEITAVVRRVRAADPGRVVVVAPGRSRATSSVVALRLLARAGEAEGRELAVVGDELTRSLAAEAGLAAYRSVEDARLATPADPAATPAPRHAAIHVVRGPASSQTAATLAAVPLVSADTEARPRSVARPASVRARRARRVGPLVPVLTAAGAILLSAVVSATTILPAATIRITPRSEPIGPVPYTIAIGDAERTSGTVTATAVVTATGTYPIQSFATGAVTFLNWNIRPVTVEAGTLVAAELQAFATDVTVTVPRGRLTPAGLIQAGEATVDVEASAVGPAANVPPLAIDHVLSEPVASDLRGFPDNPEELVFNQEATAGGVDTTGIEISQPDVDAALASLREALDAAVATALEGTDEGLVADPADPLEPVITGLDYLVGTRDTEQVEIRGELAYDRLTADPDVVVARARERFEGQADLVPAGHLLLAEATSVRIGEVSRDGTRLEVAVTVSGRSAVVPDPDVVIERVIGLTVDEAETALADLGEAEVSLWPAWVASVPANEWRIAVEVTGVEGAEPVPGGL